MDDIKEMRSSRHKRADAHMYSLRLWKHAQDLNRAKPDGVPEMGDWSGQDSPPITKKLSLTTVSKGKISFLQ